MQQFVLHAHFYQPERLNPWTGALDPEPSAAPDRDWNQRIWRECYRSNSAARIFDGQRRVERIVNNYERVSFNFGPTLLSWLENRHPRTYARVLDGDWRSAVGSGHGNALAQAYNHMILPLASDRDGHTQVAWGLADFRHRFGREAEGLWLPETACNPATIDVLIDAGIRFTVLAPHQAARVRSLPGGGEGEHGPWHDASSALSTGRAYRHYHSDGSRRWLSLFFYDGGLAQGLAFDPATVDAHVLLERLHASTPPGGGLISAALDGETFGHHHAFGELGLAYALFEGAERRGMQPTNYAAWLDEHPATDEVEVVGGEGTAWSCGHGVGRWSRDCGCSTDALPGWNQAWRAPLRQALDVVRETAVAAMEGVGRELLRDPWRAREEYIGVHLGAVSRADFLDRHALRTLDTRRTVDLWALLEAQRHAMNMYTSCGWFFADVSGLETVYVLRFAARALGLLDELGVKVPVGDVLDALGEARSNKPEVGSAADVWRNSVQTAVVTPTRVAAHTALRGLLRRPSEREPTAGHVVTLVDHRSESRGQLALTTARMIVESDATGRPRDFAVAAVHLGGLDFHGVAGDFPGDYAWAQAVERLWAAFPTAPVARLIRLVAELLEGEEFGLEQLLPDGRQEVVGAVFSELNQRFGEQYARLYRDHQRTLEMLVGAGYELPRNLRAAAELTLSAQLEHQLAQAGDSPRSFAAIEATLRLARSQGYSLDLTPVEQALTGAVTEAAATAAATLRTDDASRLVRYLALGTDMGVDIDLAAAQEQVYEVAVKARAGRLGRDESDAVAALGRVLGLSPAAWSATRH